MSPSRNDTVTTRCGACGDLLPPRARLWCSDACRQAGWRRRHAPTSRPAELLPAAPHRRENIVYECPNCETRLLGVQRCEDCGTFTRRLGLGGHCPHCDEPVTIDEVLDP